VKSAASHRATGSNPDATRENISPEAEFSATIFVAAEFQPGKRSLQRGNPHALQYLIER
jgi:hypothetical protein